MQLTVLRADSTAYPPSLREALRQRRIELGLTQRDLANLVNGPSGEPTHQSVINQWERGKVNPPPHRLALWASALGVQVVMGLQLIPAGTTSPKV